MSQRKSNTRLALNAHAKVNLDLRIGPRRRDGYHSLETVFQEISLQDRLWFKKTSRKTISLELFHPPSPGVAEGEAGRGGRLGLPAEAAITAKAGGGAKRSANLQTLSSGKDNLIIRALTQLKAALNVKEGLHVTLEKNIPMGAGLGGGSSDAAAALWGGWLLWKKNARQSLFRRRVPPLLKRLAPKLGADVAFFLKGGRASGKGIGERLKTLTPRKKEWLILITPPCHVATKKAYAWLDESRKKVAALSKQRGTPRNDFEPVIVKRFPAVRAAKEALMAAGCRQVMMSGSGSSVFGLSASPAAGRRILSAIRKTYPRSWLVHTI